MFLLCSVQEVAYAFNPQISEKDLHSNRLAQLGSMTEQLCIPGDKRTIVTRANYAAYVAERGDTRASLRGVADLIAEIILKGESHPVLLERVYDIFDTMVTGQSWAAVLPMVSDGVEIAQATRNHFLRWPVDPKEKAQLTDKCDQLMTAIVEANKGQERTVVAALIVETIQLYISEKIPMNETRTAVADLIGLLVRFDPRVVVREFRAGLLTSDLPRSLAVVHSAKRERAQKYFQDPIYRSWLLENFTDDVVQGEQKFGIIRSFSLRRIENGKPRHYPIYFEPDCDGTWLLTQY